MLRSDYRRIAGDLPLRDDQADALRRRRLSDPVAALGDPLQYARLPERAWPRTPRAARCWVPASISACTPTTKPTGAFGRTQIIRMIRREGGRCLIGLVGVQSNQFPRAVDLAQPFLAAGLPVCIGGFHISGCIAMLPELPADIKAAQDAGHFVLRRRSRGTPARRGAARCLERQAHAALQLHGRPAGPGRRAAAVPAAQARPAHRRHPVEHRSRPRLSLPVLVLHHHQRAGPQEPHPLARRSGKDRARELRPRHQAVLHHRRQFRPQQGLGAAVRPHDRRCGTARG